MAILWNPGMKRPNSVTAARTQYMGPPAIVYEGVLVAIGDSSRISPNDVKTALETRYPNDVDSNGDTTLMAVMVRVESFSDVRDLPLSVSLDSNPAIPSTPVFPVGGPPTLSNADMKRCYSEDSAIYLLPNDEVGDATWNRIGVLTQSNNHEFTVSFWVAPKGRSEYAL